jgi:hypothetical protein
MLIDFTVEGAKIAELYGRERSARENNLPYIDQ